MKTIDDVQSFLESFFIAEYELHKDRKRGNGTRNQYIDRVYDFFDNNMLSTAEYHFNSLTAWSSKVDEQEADEYIEQVLRKRKLFVVEQYQNAQYRQAIKDQGTSSDTLFVCYVSDVSEVANNRYFERFFVAEANDGLKIIATEQTTMHNEWKEYGEFKSIEDFGEFVQAKKIQAPMDEVNLKHYNSL
ncbi:MAG: hypothetical protein MUC49_06580 [Raineya sp.]|jgi:hypothetical protein|nr:hypothetical protein [Raineya sp.]